MDEEISGKPAAKPRSVGSALFWRIFALINFVAVAWVAWLIWQLSPKPLVHEFVMRMPAAQRTSLGVITAPGARQPGQPGTTEPAEAPTAPADLPMQSGDPINTLKLDTEIRTPTKAPGGSTPAR